MTATGRRVARAAGALAAATAAACGGGAPGNSLDGASGAAAITPCGADVLDGSLRVDASGAGRRYGHLSLTNGDDAECRLEGYPALELVDGEGRPLPTRTAELPAPGPSAVRVAPGQSARADLRWSVVPGQGAADGSEPCGTTPAALRVTPPAGGQPLAIAWDFGPVCGGGLLEVTAVHAEHDPAVTRSA